MKNRIIAVLVMMFAAFSGVICGGYGWVSTATAQEPNPAADVGNAKCPVTGDPVDGVHYYAYKGKRYGLCCPMCQTTFASDPEKYAAIADKEVAEKK